MRALAWLFAGVDPFVALGSPALVEPFRAHEAAAGLVAAVCPGVAGGGAALAEAFVTEMAKNTLPDGLHSVILRWIFSGW